MSDENKQIARRFIEAFTAGDVGGLEEVVAENVLDHNLSPGQTPGRQSLLDTVTMFRTAFPDIETTVVQQIAEGPFVVQNGVFSGTHAGELMGMPATNRRAQFSWIDIYRVAEGKIVEAWHVEDIVGLLAQLAAQPAEEVSAD